MKLPAVFSLMSVRLQMFGISFTKSKSVIFGANQTGVIFCESFGVEISTVV